MAHEKMIEELQARRAKALGMGGPDKLARREAQGVLNARSRLDLLLETYSYQTFEERVRTAIVVALTSPNFLYRPEVASELRLPDRARVASRRRANAPLARRASDPGLQDQESRSRG